MFRRLPVFLAIGCTVFFLCTCIREPGLPIPPDLQPPVTGLQRDFKIVGWSQEGRPIYAHIYGNGPDTAILFAGLHGNAQAPTGLLRQFMTHLNDHPALLQGRRVVVVPQLNPDGSARRSRTNARGVDLNRNFPTRNWRPHARAGNGPGSEAESRAVLDCLETFSPHRVLVLSSPLFQITAVGQARFLARRMAEKNDYPLALQLNRYTSGSLGRYTGLVRLIPTIIMDLRQRNRYEGMWAENFEALEVFVVGE